MREAHLLPRNNDRRDLEEVEETRGEITGEKEVVEDATTTIEGTTDVEGIERATTTTITPAIHPRKVEMGLRATKALVVIGGNTTCTTRDRTTTEDASAMSEESTATATVVAGGSPASPHRTR